MQLIINLKFQKDLDKRWEFRFRFYFPVVIKIKRRNNYKSCLSLVAK